MKINQKSPIVDTWRAALSVPAGYLTREGTEESEINLPLESVRCSRRASIGVQEQRESTLPYVGSWIIIVPRKHDNLYRKNRFLVVARIGNCSTVSRKPSKRSTNALVQHKFYNAQYITTVNEYRNMNIHRAACFYNSREFWITAIVQKKKSQASQAIISSHPPPRRPFSGNGFRILSNA